MASKKKFGSANELNRTELSKVSCLSQCPSPWPPKSHRLSQQSLSRIPSSFRGSKIISSASLDLSPFYRTEPVTVYVQDQNVTPSEEMPLATSTPKKKYQKDESKEKEKKPGSSNMNNDQTNKSDEPRSSRFRKSTSSNKKNSADQGQSELPPIKEETKDEYDHELYHTSPRIFKPRLYNFKNPLYNLSNFEKNSFKVLAPPFWVLVDHMIAVVWCLYSGDKREKVEVVHLQWALEFARWLRDEKGDHSKIVKNLIGVFQEAIFDKKSEENKETPDDYESYEDAHAVHAKDDEMTSVTLQDILLRTSGLPPNKVCGPCSAGGPIYESGVKESPCPPAPPISPSQSERLKNNVEDEDQERLLKFLEQMRESQNDKVNKESNRLQDLDENFGSWQFFCAAAEKEIAGAIEALKEGKLKFDEWLKEHFQ